MGKNRVKLFPEIPELSRYMPVDAAGVETGDGYFVLYRKIRAGEVKVFRAGHCIYIPRTEVARLKRQRDKEVA